MGPLAGGGQLSLSHGPPASDKQVAYLLVLLRKAAYEGFRDARHPLGLTQRQAAGKFTRSEASTLIEQLLETDSTPPANERPWSQPTLTSTDTAMGTSTGPSTGAPAELGDELSRLRHLPAEVLATELGRRGWTVTPPPPAGRR